MRPPSLARRTNRVVDPSPSGYRVSSKRPGGFPRRRRAGVPGAALIRVTPLRRPLQCGFPTRSWLQRREDPMRTLFPVIRGSWWIVCFSSLASAADDAAALRPHLVFYASFDEAVRGDFGGGVLLPSTRRDNPEVKGAYLDREGIDDKVFRIARGKGVHGGAL